MRHFYSCRLHVIAAALVAVGCSGSTNGSDVSGSGAGDSPTGSALYAEGGGDVTPDSIYGVWGGVLEDGGWSFDARLRLSASSATIATRCQAPNGKQGALVAVTVKARVSEEEIAYLESKTDERTVGDITCRANARPLTFERCTAEVHGFERNCFTLSGTKLTIYGTSPLESVEMTKLAD